MKEAFQTIGGILLFIILIVALTWFAQGNSFFMYKFFAPKTEQVRREVFEQSKAYRQGVVQELQNIMMEYPKASPEQKVALRVVALHKSADTPADALPPHVNAFISELRNPQTSVQEWQK